MVRPALGNERPGFSFGQRGFEIGAQRSPVWSGRRFRNSFASQEVSRSGSRHIAFLWRFATGDIILDMPTPSV